MNKIGIIDYGLGNVKCVENSINYNKFECRFIKESAQIYECEKIILPGVGSFQEASKRLQDGNYFHHLKEWVSNSDNKLLGICLGMQLLCTSSEESEDCYPGFSFIDEKVTKLSSRNYKVLPNIGWSDVTFIDHSMNVFNGDYYFVHSYGVCCSTPSNAFAYSSYGTSRFASGITNSSNVYGMQFHPEKSHLLGLSLMKWFCKL